MFKLPFDKWTLRFYNQQHELQYQNEQQEHRLLCLRLYNVALFIVCLVALFVFVAQEQPINIIYVQSSLTILTFINILIGKLFMKCFRIIFTCNFIISVPSAAYVASYGAQVPQFIQGYAVGALLIFILQNMENKVRLICACATPFVYIGIFDGYHLSLLQYISFTIICSILSAVQLHQNEYNQRLVFSQKLINEKQKDIIYEQVKHGLIIVSMDERSRQFELEFYNKQIEQDLRITNTQTMKEFLRDVIINDKSVRNSQDFKQGIFHTLEQCLFSVLNKEEGNIKENNPQNYFYCDLQKYKENNSYHINVSKINLGRSMLLVQIIKDESNVMNDQNEKELLQVRKTVAEEIWKTANELKLFAKGINTFGFSPQSAFCCVFSVINQMKNLTIHMQNEKIQLLRNDIKQISLRDLVNQVTPYFIFKAQKQKVQLQLQNQVNKNLIVNINTKFLIQILMNVFELALKQSRGVGSSKQGMILTIELETNLNPLSKEHNPPYIKQQQSLLKIAFHYQSEITNNQPQPQMLEIVTNKLISVVGPYNHIFNNSDQEITFSGLKLKCTYFYIYTDQSILDLSFTTQICQPMI